ncbi:MAG: hypothetical protein KQH63_04840 [Desulfobulbaceae bacterium]|nr:hypothetical protein [Desulfobulbaceae bacterium]
MPERLSDMLNGYTGPNPFHDAQFRAYDSTKSRLEFYPTSFFWSLFNEENEILVGTRGSGKTALLRMLTYSNLKHLNHKSAKTIIETRQFIGFYVPMNLEFMGALPGQRVPQEDRIVFFQYAFNCAAIHAFLSELREVLKDVFADRKLRAGAEFDLCEYLSTLWFADIAPPPASITDLIGVVDQCFNSIFNLKDVNQAPEFRLLAQPILLPIKNAIRGLEPVLNIDMSHTHWLVCIDEAEFLDKSCLQCINTFMRAAERPLVLKMATLPYKHNTRATNQPGIFVEPHGSDFNYRRIDLDHDSSDFIGLTNFVCQSRLKRCGIQAEDVTLQSFLGKEGHGDDLVDYYRAEMGDDETSEETIMSGIKEALSEQREKRIDELSGKPKKLKHAYLKKFAPIYYVRRMRKENSKGNRTTGWFAGAATIRRVADGNPRRFIQIMNAIFKVARCNPLTPKEQHRAISNFCDDMHTAVEGYPEFGMVLRGLIDQVGNVLQEKVHGPDMKFVGCKFSVSDDILNNELLFNALELGIAYCFIKTDEQSFLYSVTEESSLRLSYLLGVYFWLPLREVGEPPRLRHRGGVLPGLQPKSDPPLNRKQVKQVLGQLELPFNEKNK